METTRQDGDGAGDGRAGGVNCPGMRITTVRVLVQAVLFGLFLAFVLLATSPRLDRLPNARHWVGKFLDVDPLLGLTTALSTHRVYRGLAWSLVVLIPTLFLGRFFCSWICPYGTLHQFARWALGGRRDRHAVDANRHRPRQQLKYAILVALLVAACFGALQVGLFDPLCILHRSLTGSVMPAAGLAAGGLSDDTRLYQGAWLLGYLFFALLALNLVLPRFFCRVVCPLGALLGVLGRFAWWRIERDPHKCRGCQRCALHCEGACEPDGHFRAAECFVCLNCIEACPEGALRFAWFGAGAGAAAEPDVSRRKVLLAAAGGALFMPLIRLSGRSTRDFASRAVRPPGAVEELAFLARCVRCDQCVRVCPTNVLQPALLECGLEGLWSPVLNFRLGYCQLHCTACGPVCPTGAIRPLGVAEKLGEGAYAGRGPIRLGTAHIDPARCIAHSQGIPCAVCEEVCPTSPKAIDTERRAHAGPAGTEPVFVAVPRVDGARCIGCGICEHECPVVGDRRAIYVTADGETRSADRPERDRNRSVRPPRAE